MNEGQWIGQDVVDLSSNTMLRIWNYRERGPNEPKIGSDEGEWLSKFGAQEPVS